MKEYRLTSWPDLPAEYRDTRYHRVLHDMSQRFMSLKQLMASSTLRRGEMRAFMQMLATQELLHQRPRASTSLAGRLSNALASPLRWLASR